MSMRYKGAVLSATAPVTSSSSAIGIWTMRQQLQAVGGTGWPNALAPTTIGQAFGGGYYAGKISTAGTGVADYYLIVAPKATGEGSSKQWKTTATSTSGTSSVINGPTNSSNMNNASHPSAQFCEGLTIGGYTDWYMPAKNELEVLYYFLKPSVYNNNINWGSNANAVSPEPISTDYTLSSPAQTSAGIGFRTGETNAFDPMGYYWASTEYSGDTTYAWYKLFLNGTEGGGLKTDSIGYYVRAVRRVPV
jgi:hypothetical protein